MLVRPATLDDLDAYQSAARVLAQYVPAAHAEYAAGLRERVANATLFAVSGVTGALAWFSLDAAASRWWAADGAAALYLAGIVVSRAARGQGLGHEIVRWSAAEARRRSQTLLRLDCHAGNRWLCRYYESQGFALQGKVEQHPGYLGCLYQLTVPDR
jgi:GNAT superfamily N-acetyltransferase